MIVPIIATAFVTFVLAYGLGWWLGLNYGIDWTTKAEMRDKQLFDGPIDESILELINTARQRRLSQTGSATPIRQIRGRSELEILHSDPDYVKALREQ